MGKRFFGWLSWNLRRSRVHRAEVLESLLADLKAQAPDHVAITGDLTNVALRDEFETAARWLSELGDPSWVTVIPGNHDAYVPVETSASWDLWSAYMLSDGVRNGGLAPTHADYPTVRVRGELAIVGLCSATPTPIFQASGHLGKSQLERLESMLVELEARDLCRVVLVHHPVRDERVSPRRRLVDSEELRGVLERVGAELVLHGHNHRTSVTFVEGPRSPIPVIGVRSASDIGVKEHKRAQYHLYQVERVVGSGDSRFEIGMQIRGYDRQTGDFVTEAEYPLEPEVHEASPLD